MGQEWVGTRHHDKGGNFGVLLAYLLTFQLNLILEKELTGSFGWWDKRPQS